ncbi:MAG: SIMPL domain-containing protein [Myxococcales bacterium]
MQSNTRTFERSVGSPWRCRFLVLWAAFTFLPTLSAFGHSEADTRNRVSFQVEVMREVANDWVTARLAVVSEGKDPAVVAAAVNRQMASALGIANKSKGVEVGSGAYTTQPVYDAGRIIRWRARQEIRIESENVDRLSKLIGKLQESLVVLSSITFSVQRKTRTDLEEALIEEALEAFRARAVLIAKGMDRQDWSLVSISVGQSGSQPRMVHSRMDTEQMFASKASPPAFEAGTSEIRFHVKGSIELD